MILKTPYDFSLLKLHNISNVLNGITKYIITDYSYIQGKEKRKINQFKNDSITLNPVLLYGISDIEKDIPPFSHAVFNFQEKWVAMDLRAVVTADKNDVSYIVRNEAEHDLILQRFILSSIWALDNQNDLYSLRFAHFAFGDWLSDNLTKRFGLDLNNQIQLKILALIYYTHLFTNSFSADDLNKLIIRLSKELYSSELIEEIYNKTEGKINNIEEFCNACYLITGNIRLKGLEPNVLLNIISNNWLGLNGKELAILSLEHPPTWIALVYAALMQRNFKKNYIAVLVDKMNKRGKGDEFLKAYIYLIRNYIGE